jgi:hypothetical protein
VRHRWHAALFSLSLLYTAPTGAVSAEPPTTPLDIQVKAAFLAKFAAYVNWPPAAAGAPNDPIQLCVIGRDPFGTYLDQAVAHEHVDTRVLVVRRLSAAASAKDCHIAFVGGSPTQSIAAMLGALRAKPVLTVTDGALGTDRGMVHFALQNGRVRFHIDDARAAQADLSISARLMSLALSVKPRARAS